MKSLANCVEQFADCNKIYFDGLGFLYKLIDFVSIFV